MSWEENNMRLSHLFGRTLREIPSDAELISHQLSLRAGLIRQMGAGIYSYMPLGWRVMKKIEQILREEMDVVGFQDMMMPVVHPAELWQSTKRWYQIGDALLRFKDRTGHDMVLAMTHEEVVVDLLKREISSYRQLPVLVYHIQTKFRDEPRSRGGLVRVREFTMKDAYSAHDTWDGIDEFYPDVYQAYVNVFRRCGLNTLVVQADSGIMGGSMSHEFMAVSPQGEDTLITCESCDYAANAEAATFVKPDVPEEAEKSAEAVATPGCKTIEEVANFLGTTPERTLKAVFYASGGRVIFGMIRGDLEVNEVKLSNALGAPPDLHVADEEELKDAGVVAGYASPVGLTGFQVVVDESVQMGNNFIAGANKDGYHLINVNYPRDFQADVVADISLAEAGHTCENCGSRLTVNRGIEVGHLFKLGTKYSEAVGATFLDQDGEAKPLVMGSYGIGVGRLMAAVIEQHHDEHGIIWPLSLAPFQIHIVSLGTDKPEVVEQAEALYGDLQAKGYDVLYDERNESAGVKFNDADLIGVPLRLTVSLRNIKNNAIEAKCRWADERHVVPLDQLYGKIDGWLASGPSAE
jgi:prolyl-tRNA synthetase